jgi:hypothetical protein
MTSHDFYFGGLLPRRWKSPVRAPEHGRTHGVGRAAADFTAALAARPVPSMIP